MLSQTKLDGRDAYLLKSFCTGSPNSQVAVEGDRLHLHYGGKWQLSLDASLPST